MKIRAMENIPTGFTFPAADEKTRTSANVYQGKPIACGAIVDVSDEDAAPLLAAGVAEPSEKKAVAEVAAFGKKG